MADGDDHEVRIRMLERDVSAQAEKLTLVDGKVEAEHTRLDEMNRTLHVVNGVNEDQTRLIEEVRDSIPTVEAILKAQRDAKDIKTMASLRRCAWIIGSGALTVFGAWLAGLFDHAIKFFQSNGGG